MLRGSTADRYASAELTPAGVEVVRYNSQQEANMDLVAGRLDAVVADSVNLEDGFLKTDAGKGLRLRRSATDRCHFGEGVGIAAAGEASWPASSTRPSTLRANGSKQIQDKYFSFDVYGSN